MQRRQRIAQAAFAARRQDQMNMIGHQALAPTLNLSLGARVRGELKIADVIGVAEKRRLPAIATLGDMMRRIRRNDPAYARFPAAMYTF